MPKPAKHTGKIVPTIILAVGITITAIFMASGGNSGDRYGPEDFTTDITNKYFTLRPGAKIVYKAKTPDGPEKTVIETARQTKVVNGTTTLVMHDRVWLKGKLIEDTHDYLAQHKTTADVWYFGEDVDNYENGKLKDHEGSWLAGKDGARAGIWIQAAPEVGTTYREEFYKGHAEDKAKVLSVNSSVQIKNGPLKGTYRGCLRTLNFTPLEPNVKEYKFYCPKFRTLTVELGPDGERIELFSEKGRAGR